MQPLTEMTVAQATMMVIDSWATPLAQIGADMSQRELTVADLQDRIATIDFTALAKAMVSVKDTIRQMETEQGRLVASLTAIVPYAESRAEDMSAEAEELAEAFEKKDPALQVNRADVDRAHEASHRVWDEVATAKAVLGEAECYGRVHTLRQCLDKAMAQLETIRNGAQTARWLTVGLPRESVGYDRDDPDEGYYDAENPPEGYDREGYFGDEQDSGEILAPAEWVPFEIDEQEAWITDTREDIDATLAEIKAALA